MTKKPLVNALAAIFYIALIASVMFYGLRQVDHVDSVLAPITILSLFTLSAAVMAYIFLYQPIQLYFDGKKKQAVDLFFQTVVFFAGITVCVLIAVFLGILS